MDIKKYREKLNAVRNQKFLNGVNKIFKKNQVGLAYLFGSQARGTMGPLSDIDIAVLFAKKVKKDNYFDKRIKIASEIDRILKTYKTEVICLNEATPFLKHRVVYRGVPIYVSNLKLQRNFELQVLQEYEDFNYHLETSFKIMERQIKEGLFGKAPLSPKEKRYFSKYVNR